MAKLVVRAIKSALSKQKELHKKQFDLLRSENLSEENAGRIKALVKGIPKDKKSKDPLEYNPDMKHFTGAINGQKLEEPMKEKDLYTHLTSKGVSDRAATELIVRLKAPYENKEKIDKLLKTAKKFGDMAKKQSENRKRVKGKFVPLTDKQKERQEKYHKIRKQHEGNAKKLGHDSKHPLWSNPTDPLDSIRKAQTKPKLESIMEALRGSEIVQKYASKGQTFEKGRYQPSNLPRGGYTSSPTKTTNNLSSAETKGSTPKPKGSTPKPKAQTGTTQKAGTFRRVAGALAGYAVSRSFSSMGPVGRMVGAHLGVSLAKRIGTKKIKPR